MSISSADPNDDPSAVVADVAIIEVGGSCAELWALMTLAEVERPLTRIRARQVLFWVAALVLLLARAMFLKLDHDENQFIAGGALLAREGLLPYRDFPYFHVPYQVFLFAGLFQISTHLLLIGRLLCAMGGWGTALALTIESAHRFNGHDPRLRKFISLSVGLLFLLNPLFGSTSGRAWNHDLPTLFTLLAFISLRNGLCAERAAPWAVLAGVFAGVATGLRLTFVLTCAAFLAMTLLHPDRRANRRIKTTAWLVLGLVIGLAPLIVLVILAPHQAWFGNFIYPLLNTQYRVLNHFDKGMNLFGRLWFMITKLFVQPGNLAVYALFGMAVWIGRFRSPFAGVKLFELRILLGLVAMLFVGAFAPNPAFMQYFYAPIPFMILAGAYAAAIRISPADSRARKPMADSVRGWRRGLTLAVIASAPVGILSFRHVYRVFAVSHWIPNQVHVDGERLAKITGGGHVLTFSPLMPLEGGLTIYPELATGPFAFRIAPLVSESQEAGLRLLDEDDLGTTGPPLRPDLVLIGSEIEVDGTLIAYADRNSIPIFSWIEGIPHSLRPLAAAGSTRPALDESAPLRATTQPSHLHETVTGSGPGTTSSSSSPFRTVTGIAAPLP